MFRKFYVSYTGAISFSSADDLNRKNQVNVEDIRVMFLKYRILEPDIQVSGIMEEFSFVDSIGELENSLYSNEG